MIRTTCQPSGRMLGHVFQVGKEFGHNHFRPSRPGERRVAGRLARPSCFDFPRTSYWQEPTWWEQGSRSFGGSLVTRSGLNPAILAGGLVTDSPVHLLAWSAFHGGVNRRGGLCGGGGGLLHCLLSTRAARVCRGCPVRMAGVSWWMPFLASWGRGLSAA